MALPSLTESVERLSRLLIVVQLAYAYRAAHGGVRAVEYEARRRLFAALDALDKEV